MAWPEITDFSNSVQNPGWAFSDPELANGEVAMYERGGRAGMPIVAAGNYAAVYRVSTGALSFAVRCFTRTVNDQRDRYSQLDAFLKTTMPPAFTEFEYQEKGIQVRGEWYPIVKMDWVNGESMNKFVQNNLDSPNSIKTIAARWRGLVSALRSLNVAHNDLQHGNVMVQPDRSLRLVDYDAVFLPQYAGQTSPEMGHQHFQPPLRTPDKYDATADNFPALVVYTSLLALIAEPSLWDQFYNEDNLIFRKVDYGDPAQSRCFAALKNSPDEQVRCLAFYLEHYCSQELEVMPDLETIVSHADAYVIPTAAAQPVASDPVYQPEPPPMPAYQPQPDVVPPPSPAAAQPVAPEPVYQPEPPPMPAYQPQPVVVPPPSPAAAAPAGTPTIACSQCGQENSQDLVYCANRNCLAQLHQGERFCMHCGGRNPVNARFCAKCGRPCA